MREFASWRHLLAFAITAAAAGLIWSGTRISLTEPLKPKRRPVMHVTLTRPPAPEAPPPPKPAPPPMKAPAPAKALPQAVAPPLPAVTAPNADVAAAAPAISQSAAAAPAAASSSAPAAPPAAPAPSAPSGDAALEAAYFARIRAAIEEQKHYPMTKDARLQQPKGTVVVWFVLNRAGALKESGVEQSGGSILDRAALESVHRTAYPPIPAATWPGEEQHRFSADLRFAPQ